MASSPSINRDQNTHSMRRFDAGSFMQDSPAAPPQNATGLRARGPDASLSSPELRLRPGRLTARHSSRANSRSGSRAGSRRGSVGAQVAQVLGRRASLSNAPAMPTMPVVETVGANVQSNPTIQELMKANERLLTLEELLIRMRRDYDAERNKNRKLTVKMEEMSVKDRDISRQNVELRKENDDLAAKVDQLRAQIDFMRTGKKSSATLKARDAKVREQTRKEVEAIFDKRLERVALECEDLKKQRERLRLKLRASKNTIECNTRERKEQEARFNAEKLTWETEVLRIKDYLAGETAIKNLIYDMNLERQAERGLKPAHTVLRPEGSDARPSTPVETTIVVSRWLADMSGEGQKGGTKQLTTVEKAFQRIMDIMGASDIDSAIEMFIASSEDNTDLVARLENANEMNKQLREELSRAQKEMEVYSRTHESHAYKKSTKLEAKVRQLLARRNELLAEVRASRQLMSEVRAAVSALIIAAKAGDDTVAFLKEGVVNENVIKCLGAVEEKVLQLQQRPTVGKGMGMLNLAATRDMTTTAPLINPNTTTMVGGMYTQKSDPELALFKAVNSAVRLAVGDTTNSAMESSYLGTGGVGESGHDSDSGEEPMTREQLKRLSVRKMKRAEKESESVVRGSRMSKRSTRSSRSTRSRGSAGGSAYIPRLPDDASESSLDVSLERSLVR